MNKECFSVIRTPEVTEKRKKERGEGRGGGL
jgi:hypothetical protein